MLATAKCQPNFPTRNKDPCHDGTNRTSLNILPSPPRSNGTIRSAPLSLTPETAMPRALVQVPQISGESKAP